MVKHSARHWHLEDTPQGAFLRKMAEPVHTIGMDSAAHPAPPDRGSHSMASPVAERRPYQRSPMQCIHLILQPTSAVSASVVP